MKELFNGMPAGRIPGATWVKAATSAETGACVEMTPLPSGGAAMRNSTDPEGAALVFTAREFRAFLGGVKNGEFDHMVAASS
ncbi:DUF397 domain-containing protein [Kitasatospora sp. NPDC018619]|uniref:DUF397 domain-containing protein n=1 Tax=unclassified Kitasatospora TaxID=2633591 RepID=UPI0037AF905C